MSIYYYALYNRKSTNDVDTENIMGEVHDKMKDINKEHQKKRMTGVRKGQQTKIH